MELSRLSWNSAGADRCGMSSKGLAVGRKEVVTAVVLLMSPLSWEVLRGLLFPPFPSSSAWLAAVAGGDLLLVFSVPGPSSVCSVISPSRWRRNDEEDDFIDPALVPNIAEVPRAASLSSAASLKENIVS